VSSRYPLRAIASVERKVIVRYVWWLTLACGHQVRVVGPHPPKKRARCYTCWRVADEAAIVYYATCWTCGDEPTTPGYARGQYKRVRISLRLRTAAAAQTDCDEHVTEHPGHRVSVMREANLAAAQLGAAADALGAELVRANGLV